MPLSTEDAFILSESATAYENDNSNPKKAYEYFVELNKHHYYLSVIREYEGFKERAPASSKSQKGAEWETRLTGQYEYALDHIKQGTTGSES